MPLDNDCHRRKFIQVSGTALLATSLASLSRKARAELKPAGIRIALLTDTYFTSGDDPSRSDQTQPGWLFAHAFALADDLMRRFSENSSGATALVLHGGNLIHCADRIHGPKQAEAAQEWLSRSLIPIRLTLGSSDLQPAGLNRKQFFSRFSEFGFFNGRGYYSYNHGGFHFIHLDAGDLSSDSASHLHDRRRQLAWLRQDLAQSRELPTVIVLHPPLLPLGSSPSLNLFELDRRALLALLRSYPQVLLVLGGKTLANHAEFIPETATLCLTTASPVIYPCAGRTIELNIQEDQSVIIRSEFLQTRHLEWAEDSFYQGMVSSTAIIRLGRREDRTFSAQLNTKALERKSCPLNPALAPWWPSQESVALAVVSDPHLCLDEFLDETDAENNDLIGHFMEKGSRAIFSDILDQIARGRHRVEFFDETFSRDPEANGHYSDLPVDVLLLCGDVAEHGRRAEALLALQGLSGLPSALRERSLVALGNHDLFRGEFAQDGAVSSKKPILDFYQSFGFTAGQSYYVAPLADWLTLIVLDSTIPNLNGMGLIQEQIDWLEDQIEQRPGQALVIACHHPIYPITLVPPAMDAYLRHRSHFTPPLSAARVQLHHLFAHHPQVKLVISGHYHGVCVDQYQKKTVGGSRADDPWTTHVQVPCTVEYPCGYTLFKFSRSQEKGRIEYQSAYSRLADLRRQSSQALLYRILGNKVKVPARYQGSLARLSRQDNIFGRWAGLNAFDIIDLNMRGFKDGTANAGRGNSGKGNLKGKIEFTL